MERLFPFQIVGGRGWQLRLGLKIALLHSLWIALYAAGAALGWNVVNALF